MGQKVNPIGFRLCVNKNWNSRWYAEKSYAETLKEDLDIQHFVKNRLKKASISKIEVERASKKTKINIFTAKPGIIIGRKGDEVERIRKSLLNKFKKDMTGNNFTGGIFLSMKRGICNIDNWTIDTINCKPVIYLCNVSS